ncbi:putative P-loop containing nucleoside triphosphate hydrolase protein [Lyophyllum shimeji]|uniref:P-loop containing nucleoside triphosphate hydrolase protein n=1 Tax=Lyophyllum shimeji TaxID=47721 RepID=A0A9P3PDW7_LYOSH|nr:putative P-loop containing nucleoside triphosphate hydrolase protein [Lyophyllum shimeji]
MTFDLSRQIPWMRKPVLAVLQDHASPVTYSRAWMADKKKGAQAKPKIKSIATKQRTLYDLFPKKANLSSDAAAEIPRVPFDASPEPNSVALTPSSPAASEEISTAIVVEKLRQASLEPRPIHRFFTKATPSMQGNSPSENPSMSDDTMVEAINDRSPSTSNTALEDLTEHIPPSQQGGSQEDPIVLDSSPLKVIRPPNPRKSDRPLAPLFARAPPKTSAAAVLSKTATYLLPPDTPYGRRAGRITPTPNETSEEISRFFSNLRDGQIYTSIYPRNSQSASVDDSRLTPAPTEDLRHPAATRLSTQLRHSAAHRLWVDKWRPTRAAEVLGNEANALYLRDWLRAHELHLATDESSAHQETTGGKGKEKTDTRGTKRPRVVRAVEKRRGRKKRRIDSDDEDDDSWIVYSDAPEAYDTLDAYSEGGRFSSPLRQEDPTDEQQSSPAPILGSETVAQQSFDPLTNTILLTGPSGTGKTAAVYACAEELDWEVLEVYPGLGKRNAPGIDSFIGDAGKNHHVRKTRLGDAGISGGRNALSNLLKANKHRISADETIVDIEESSTPSRDAVTAPGRSERTTEAAPLVRQSVILLEEVDILFKDDASFWPAVIAFIKDCRRPVVCTCNDISLVPTQDLPLQAILDFVPCSPSLAAAYLQRLCSAEGYTLDHTTLLRLYENSVFKVDSLDVPELPIPPKSGDYPAPDLRRAINHLQLRCSTADSENEDVTSAWETLSDASDDLCDWKTSMEQQPRKSPNGTSADHASFAMAMGTEAPTRRSLAADHADSMSFVDSHLRRKPWHTSDALARRSCKPSNDDEIGHTMLFCPATEDEILFGVRNHDAEIASAAMWLSRGTLKVGRTRQPTSIGISPFRTRELFRARVDHQVQMDKALGDIVPLPILKTRRAEVLLEYAPSIRDIVAAEDVEERAHLQKHRPGRMTRNSGGTFVRTLVLAPESRAALTATVLPPLAV